MIFKNPTDHRRFFLVKILAFILAIVGLSLLIGGAYLIMLGGSWYYILAGVGLVLAAIKLWQGQMSGVWLYLVVFFATLVWALFEVGFAFWPLVPRLIAPLFLAGCVLMVVPLLDSSGGRPENSRPYFWAGTGFMAAFALYLIGMFWPHDILQNNLQLAQDVPHHTTSDVGADWVAWGRTGTGTRYAPFEQITPENIGNLEVAWTARTGFIADQSKHYQDQNTPLYVDGTLYHCAAGGQISAIEGTTGKIKWQFDPKADTDDWKRCRALAYFDPGDGDVCGPRIIETTVDARLISVSAADGKPCEKFGNNGTVDLWKGMGGEGDEKFLTNSSGAIVSKGKIIVGGRVVDNFKTGEPSGVIRAYDAMNGELVWVWDLGQPDLVLPLKEGQKFTKGTPNTWVPMSYDENLGMVYIGLGNATPDIYGGNRREFDDKYSSSVVALDIDSGKEVWHFQTARHDLWDYDIPAQPVLADIPDGQGGTVPSVIVTTKRAETFVLDRRTGTPIKKVEDRPAPQGDGTIEGEYYAKTQPYSVEMYAPGTEPLTESMMWGATPIDQMLCRILYHKYRYDGPMTPPGSKTSIQYPGALGGMNFGSTTVDEVRKVMVSVEMRLPVVQRLIKRDEIPPTMVYTGESGTFAPMNGTPYGLQRVPFLSPIIIPCLQPPWGTVTAIDLTSGEMLWQQPAGTSKDLAIGDFQPGLPIAIGMPPLGGPMITGGLVWHGAFQDFYMRAYNVATGEKVWEYHMPTGAQSTPMSYIGKDGRQYIVISAGGARYNPSHWGDYVIAFALPKL